MDSESPSSSLSRLTLDLVKEILVRIPAESLIRVKSVCKQWHEIITDKIFIYKNLHLFSTEPRFIRTDNDTVHIIDPMTGICSALPIPDDFRDPNSIDALVHCDGLILCICIASIEESTYTNVAIWNPTLREIKWIKPSLYSTMLDYCGIGYNKASPGDYKIVRFSDFWNWFPEVEIYEFKSDSWRTLVAELNDWQVVNSCKGVSVMGNMYWMSLSRKTHHQDDFIQGDYIQSFDFSTETFKQICVYPPSYSNILGCFNGDRLSLLQQGTETWDIEVLITNKLSDEVVSFTTYFSVVHSVVHPDLPALQFDTYFARAGYYIGKHRNIIALCEAHVEEEEEGCNNGYGYVSITCYEINEDGIRNIELIRYEGEDNSQSSICGYVYIPSLIWVP